MRPRLDTIKKITLIQFWAIWLAKNQQAMVYGDVSVINFYIGSGLG